MAAPSPPHAAAAAPVDGALPDLSQLKVVSVHDAQPVLLTSLWAGRPRTMVVFLRHWMWEACQDYFISTVEQFKGAQSAGGAGGVSKDDVQLVFIGCGTTGLGKSLYKRVIGEKDPNISMYTDSKRESYAAMGASYGIPHFRCGNCVTGLCMALWQGLTRCWCFCSAGNVEQQGAAFVMSPGPGEQAVQVHVAGQPVDAAAAAGTCLFKHIEKEPGDHADAQQLFAAAGLAILPAKQEMK